MDDVKEIVGVVIEKSMESVIAYVLLIRNVVVDLVWDRVIHIAPAAATATSLISVIQSHTAKDAAPTYLNHKSTATVEAIFLWSIV